MLHSLVLVASLALGSTLDADGTAQPEGSASAVGAEVDPSDAAATISQNAAKTTEAEEKSADTRSAETKSAKDALTGEAFAETLVITASRVEEPVLESPVAVTVVGERELETAASENLGEVLRGVPGLNGIQLSARDTQFAARTASGVLSNRLLALVDGRSVYLDHQGIVLYDGLSFGLDEIRQIEILKGPGSSMWGANALAGVLNIRTKSPAEIAGGLFEVEGGENGYGRLGVRWASAIDDRTSYKVSASYLEQDAWPRDPLTASGTPIPDQFRFENETTHQPKVDFRLDKTMDNASWSYRAGYGGVDGTILSGLGPLSLRDDFYQAYGEVRRNSRRLDAIVYWNHMQGDTFNLISGDTLTSTTDTYAAEVTGRALESERQRVIYGFNARYSEFDLSWAPRGRNRSEFGVFVEDELSLTERLTLSLGGRVDHFETIGTAFSPRLSLFFAPRWNHVFRVTYNEAYRAPTVIENFMDLVTDNPVVLDPALPLFQLEVHGLGSEDLDEETIRSLEVGYTSILGGRHELALSVYRNEIDDAIRFSTTEVYGPTDPPPGWPYPPAFTPPFPKTFSPFNAGEVIEKGLEASLKTDWSSSWQTVVSYSYQQDPDFDPAASPYPVNLNSPANNQAALRIMAHQGRWSGALGVTYTDEATWRDVLDERFWGSTDDYVLVQGSLSRDFSDSTSLTLRATNLLDDAVKQHVYGDIIGRQVTLRLRLRWQ
jgi:iron complex outermembrane receptor protein